MDFYNKGIYTYSDASRLLGLSTAVIRGLVNGYKYKDKPQKPVISKKTVFYDDKEYLTFYDIIELKFINYFLIGISIANLEYILNQSDNLIPLTLCQNHFFFDFPINIIKFFYSLFT